MRVLVTTGGGAGHVGPLLPLVADLLAAGDTVLAVAPAAAAGALERAGVEVVVAADPPADVREEAWARFRGAPPEEASRIANGEIFGGLETAARLPAVTDALRAGWDVVVHEAAEYAGPVAAARAGVPHVQVAISAAEAERGSLQLATENLEAFRGGVVDEIVESPYLSHFPASLDPSPYVTTVRYRTRSATTPVPHDRPLVYVTLGTVAASVDAGGALLRDVLDALAGLDADVLVTTGRGHRPDLGARDSSVRIEEWVDQARVLPRADLVVCHGGSGTVLGALAHGVPLVVVPLFADQRRNGRSIAAAGAGVLLDRPRVAAAEAAAGLSAAESAALAEVSAAVLTDPAAHDAARRAGVELTTAAAPRAALLSVL